ncbi:Uncharacterised protein [Mycobacteroides abscessus subsp. abscessus]|nr:Uncharacterised protein [Mycobacteroides abscessus subsp. abscessus]
MLGEQLLQMRLDAVLDEARVYAKLMRGVVLDALDRDPQLLARLVFHHPDDRRTRFRGVIATFTLGFGEPAWRTHPVQRLVRAVIGMHAHRAVGLDEQEPFGRWQVGGQPANIINGALSNDETHRPTV